MMSFMLEKKKRVDIWSLSEPQTLFQMFNQKFIQKTHRLKDNGQGIQVDFYNSLLDQSSVRWWPLVASDV